jgi:hypothetical protein
MVWPSVERISGALCWKLGSVHAPFIFSTPLGGSVLERYYAYKTEVEVAFPHCTIDGGGRVALVQPIHFQDAHFRK